MALLSEKRFYRLTGFTPLLGSQPASQAVRTEWIASKAPTDDLRAEEDELFGGDDRGMNVFLRDTQAGDMLCIYDYVIRGYLKGSLAAMQAQLKVAQARSKIDKHVFTGPRMIYVMRDGKPMIDEDDVCERPLRASGPRGDRVALAASEMVLDPWTIEFYVKLYPNKGTVKSDSVTWAAIEAALDYGEDCGLGQWRNAGMGKFTWERIEKLNPAAGRMGGGWLGSGFE